ncbi:hypothetical protein [Streptomyces sp. G1]|uniref:hypothetical protein n=1 Tax=Streptomyces sp. G1 TaxID=361572 RepID=UPI00202E49CC|nr:hypothetical protein [Streptomyces sp. G1]MCM1964914.1 hypothetical protein [Streptomyces sp. G1]
MTRDQLLALVLSAPGGVDALLRQYDTAETVEMLGCTPGFLERDRAAHNHQKIGTAVRYDVIDILLIKERCRVDPSEAAQAAPAPAPAPAPVAAADDWRRLTPAGATSGRQRTR